MIKEIKYNGFTATPSDYECPDGDLAGVMNLIPEDGSLKPVFPPKPIFSLPKGKKVLYVHETSKFRHYIIIAPEKNTLSWIDSQNIPTETELKAFGASDKIYQVNAIGNTLIAQCTSGMHYFLWKGEAAGYLYLGTHLPELPISFGLQGEMVRTDEFEVMFYELSYDVKQYKDPEDGKMKDYNSWHEFTDENKKMVTSQMLAKVNKFIADKATRKGKFIYPFLVRYAYRLYDQTLTMHSAPVLMVCSTSCAPMALWRNIFGDKVPDRAHVRIVGMLHTLDYAVINASQKEALKNWGDIVKSVDVFISKPIYTYDQEGECDRFFTYNEYGEDLWGYCICKHTNQAASTTTYPLRYQKKDIGYLYQMTFDAEHINQRPGGVLGLPRRSAEQVKADIRACNQFYLLTAIKLDELKTERTALPVPDDYLQALVTREVMSDDYDSHDEIISRYSFAYNQRLNMANISKKLYNKYTIGALVNYTDGFVMHSTQLSPTYFDEAISHCVYFFIKQDGRDIIVRGSGYSLGNMSPILFLYYPNVNCYKAVVESYYGQTERYEVPMSPHDFLNGAFYFGGWDNLSKRTVGVQASPDTERIIEVPNKIYTSAVNNPFVFPVTNINTVGTGRILGISTAAKALSEGQFGQFPLYAFTTEGVWAMEVSSTGSYSARQPITRDVCINPDSITQIDSAVLFATDRGIMLLSGSNSLCISDILNGREPFNPLSLPAGEKLIKMAGFTERQVNYIPFMEFTKGCGMLYDYTHQRIIIYNPACGYAYIYSIKDKAWGMMPSDISDGINSYPEALAMDSSGALINFSEENEEEVLKGTNGILFTRPLKLDGPDILKTVDTIIQRGHFKNGHVQQILYGSRDLFHWSLVWSSTDQYLRGFRGTPYKYFRIALICKLDKAESIHGCTVQHTPRYTNQPR